MGDGRPTCNRVLTSGSVGMGIPMWIPVGMGWVWGLKCHPHGSRDNNTFCNDITLIHHYTNR